MKLYRKGSGGGGGGPFEIVVPIKTTTTYGSVSCVADFATSTITAVAHGLSDGDRVSVSAGTVPTGLSTSTMYYVVNSTLNTLQVSTTLGGGAVAFTTAGVSVQIGKVTPFWSLVLPTNTVVEVQWNIEVREALSTARRGYFIADVYCYRGTGTISMSIITSQSSQFEGGSCTDAKGVVGVDGSDTFLFTLLGVNALTLNWQGYLKYSILT